jgi:hypothetical protein
MKTLTHFLIESSGVEEVELPNDYDMIVRKFLVYRNPSAKVIRNSPIKQWRWLMNRNGDIWLWDAEKVEHYRMQMKLGLGRGDEVKRGFLSNTPSWGRLSEYINGDAKGYALRLFRRLKDGT